MNKKERIEQIKQDLKYSNKVLNALSDENRQNFKSKKIINRY